MVELLRDRPHSPQPQIVTRRCPVDFAQVKQRLEHDLWSDDFDYAIHLGQAPGSSRIRLESIGVNVGGTSHESPDGFRPLVPHGPVAYRSELPLPAWAKSLRQAGIPAQVSYHAGTYLCNALLYCRIR